MGFIFSEVPRDSNSRLAGKEYATWHGIERYPPLSRSYSLFFYNSGLEQAMSETPLCSERQALEDFGVQQSLTRALISCPLPIDSCFFFRPLFV